MPILITGDTINEVSVVIAEEKPLPTFEQAMAVAFKTGIYRGPKCHPHTPTFEPFN